MTPEIIPYLTNGGFAALFIWLLLDTRKDSRRREEKLLSALASLTKSYERMASTLDHIDTRITQNE